MKASDVMTTPAITLQEDSGLIDALRVMLDHDITGVPIVDRDGALVGMLTEGDLLRRAEIGTGERGWSALWSFIRGPGLNAADYVRAHSRRVADLMTREPLSVAEDTPLEDVVEIMERRRIKRVPVLRDGQVVGVVSRADLLRRLADMLGGPAQQAEADVLARLRAELDRQPWFTERNVSFSVNNGIVRIQGVVTDERLRAALRVAAQNASGRTEVEDELELLEPISGTVLP